MLGPRWDSVVKWPAVPFGPSSVAHFALGALVISALTPEIVAPVVLTSDTVADDA